MLVGVDGTHAAGRGAGTLGLDDGAVRATVDAAATLDAEALVNVALAVAEADGVLRADLLAGVRQAALAHGRDLDDLLRAGVAGKLDNIDQRRLVVLVCNDAVLQALAGGHALIQRTQGHAHGQTDALGDDGSLQEDAAAQRFFLTGNDLEGQLTHQLFVVGKLVDLIGHAGNLSEHLATDIRYGGVNASHVIAPLFCSVCSKSDVSAGTPAPVKILPKIHTFCKRAGNKKQENLCKIQRFPYRMDAISLAARRHLRPAGADACIRPRVDASIAPYIEHE